MQHTSEHNTCSVETWLYTVLSCMNVYNRMLSAVLLLFDIHKLDVTILQQKNSYFQSG